MTINRRLIFIMLILICPYSYAQGNFSKSISLKIKEDSLRYDHVSESASVSLVFCNDSEYNILVYGLTAWPQPAPFSLSELCDLKSTGTGIAFAIYSSDGKQEMHEIVISDPMGQRRVTREVLDSALEANKISFLKSALVLKRHEEKLFPKEISMEDFSLEKGTYYLEVIYYSGTKSESIRDSNKIKESKAKLFQGCSRSPKIPFVVK